MRIKSGTFLGTGGNTTITGVGFEGVAVFTKNRTTDGQDGRGKLASMGANGFNIATGDYWNTNITAFTSDGFSITSDFINGDTYDYVCIGEGGLEDVVQSSYTGDGSDDRDITIDPAFQPDLVIVMIPTNGSAQVRFRTSGVAGDLTRNLHPTGAPAANQIQAINSDGFQVGTDLNSNGQVYHYLCMKNSNRFKVFSYTGNGVDDRNIDGITTFQPENAFIARNAADEGVAKFKGQAGGGNSSGWNGSQSADTIQAFRPTGIQVGAATAVNNNGDNYLGMAFLDGTSSNSGGGGGGGQGGGKGGGNGNGGGGAGGGGNPGGGPPGQGGGNGKPDRFFVGNRRERRLADF